MPLVGQACRWLPRDLGVIVYFGATEGWLGASAGKAACQLRVLRDGMGVAYLPGAFLRALVFVVSLELPAIIERVVVANGLLQLDARTWSRVEPALWVIVLALLFSSARRRNGLAGLHEIVSGTRTVRVNVDSARATATVAASPAPIAIAARLGPYIL